jgi:glycosyltransferase involved in cell wall biosynthesis
MGLPKFTVVTVCLNEVDTVGKAIESVLSQKYSNLEYIVLDGGSTDGTQHVITSYLDRIDCFHSGRDSGIYDAMNHALSISTGDILYFLNSDDYFIDDGVLAYASEQFLGHPDVDILSGNIRLYNTPIIEGKRYTRNTYDFINKLDLYRKNISQQCVFTRKTLYESNSVGMFNERYSICADYEWLIRAINKNKKIRFVDRAFAQVDYTGVSYTQNKKRLKEKREIIFRNSSFTELIIYILSGLKQRLCKSLYVIRSV